ncbi:carboxypeptidase-like regulatory domain-containing protein [Alkalimarinus sediminis]|uniref:Carboxypeptidase-like regulatory domain-containing protein n=1 Tax=Alkalimarinus sediminis TaxID=1632866 RepID=A0A9E8HLM6_9ALTE|nr:carboxypeptidase-like regulatory domain-containing protein [Alkalimarinus sediminis]UZW75612.1 carboxypeptidase-like regulatory domain-containing protein [Alkalimarinus sediminis]
MKKKYSAILFSCLALSACGGGGSSDTSSTTANLLQNTSLETTPNGYISGRVTNYDSGAGLQNIQVSAGEHTTITDADGRYSLSGTPPADRLLVNFEGAGFAEHADVIYLDTLPENNIFNVSMLPVDLTVRFDSSLQQTLSDDNSSARVSLPAGGLVKADGSTPDGEVTLNLTVIDPSRDINLMPGEMVDANAGATTEPALIESFGAITVTFEDSEGNALNLKEGAISTIRIPLSDKSGNPPLTIPLYYYNKTTGFWVSEGSAVLVNGAYYEGEVSHFSTWNADDLFEQILISGCVEDVKGNRLSNINVIANGVDYSGSANTVTDTQGNFSVAAKANASVTVFGFQLGVQTSSLNTTTSTTDEQLGQCLVSSGGGITVKMSWATPATRTYGTFATPNDDDEYLSSDLIGPKFKESGVYWDLMVSLVGSLLEFPFMDIFLSDPFHETVSSGEELLVIVQFPMPGTYRYIVKNELSEYFPGIPGEYSAGFIPRARRISDSRVELNINGNITVFLPPPGEGGENVDWSTYPPGTEAPNIAWEVFEFVVANDGSFTVVPLNNWLPQTEWNGQAPPAS